MRSVSLPIEFSELNGKIDKIQRVNNNEYSSTCPSCHDSGHVGSDYPDRFRMWIYSDRVGGPFGWCRRCNFKWMPNDDVKEISSEQKLAILRERAVREREIEAKKEASVSNLNKSKIWESYHGNLNEKATSYYEARGITPFFIEYWKLGYSPGRSFWRQGQEFIVASYTIPYFTPESRVVVNLKHRLVSKIADAKYMPEFSGLPQSLYYTDIDRWPEGEVIVVEGEFKAMTTYITLDDPNMFVVGTSGKNPPEEVFETLSKCETIYILMDPDAYKGGIRNSNMQRIHSFIGDKMRVVMPPGKIDDCILDYGLGKDDIRTLLKNSIKY
jgi:hypothetical protein